MAGLVHRRDDLSLSYSRGNKEGELKLLGWVSQPSSRGTMDILWACSSTIFICVWVMLHLNVPSEKDSELTIFIRKLKWFVLAMLAPELLMLFAGGQWASAKRSIAEMHLLGAESWSMVHAFYADSGGLVLEAKDSVPFPITSEQLHWLVERQYLSLAKITRKEIWDKRKADTFAKVVAAAQTEWFTIQIVARAI